MLQYIIDDQRETKARPWGFVVATDSFMSGWGGGAPQRSLYALAFASYEERVANAARWYGDSEVPS